MQKPSSPVLTLLQNGAVDVPGAVVEFEQTLPVVQIVVSVVGRAAVDEEQDRAHDSYGDGNKDPRLLGREREEVGKQVDSLFM